MKKITEVLCILWIVTASIFAAQANTKSFSKKDLTVYEDFNIFYKSVTDNYPRYSSFFKVPGLCSIQNIKFKLSFSDSNLTSQSFEKFENRFKEIIKSDPECLFTIYTVAENRLNSFNNSDEIKLNQFVESLRSSFDEVFLGIVDPYKYDGDFIETTNQLIAEVDNSNEINLSTNDDLSENLLLESNILTDEILNNDLVADEILDLDAVEDENNEPKKLVVSQEITEEEYIKFEKNDIPEITKPYGQIGAVAAAGIGLGVDPVIAVLGSAFTVGYSMGYLDNQETTKVSFNTVNGIDNFYLNFDVDIIIHEFSDPNSNISLKMSQPFELDDNSSDSIHINSMPKDFFASEETNLNLIYKNQYSENNDFSFGLSSNIDPIDGKYSNTESNIFINYSFSF